MSKAKDRLNPGPEEIQTSSGVTVVVSPFPADLWNDVQAKALRDNPDPEPPVVIIETAGKEGDNTEQVEDFDDPEYQLALAEAQNERNSFIGEAILDLCVDVDMGANEDKIRRLTKYTELPEDQDDKRITFLMKYVLRNRADYERVMVSATTQMAVSDPEVVERLNFFRSEMARKTAGEAETSSNQDS